jgi:hypothetical protein
MARTIQSPGVEINEIDLTLRAEQVIGTSVFVAGFANQGPIDEVLEPTSISEFEQIYGTPTNAAERYFYHSVKNTLNTSPAKVLVSRIPYGQDRGDGFITSRYSALAYPVKASYTNLDTASSFTFTNLVLTVSGRGYVTRPNISIIGGGGFGASATANLADDGRGTGTYGVSSITVNSFGQYYDVAPEAIFDRSLIIETVNITFSGAGYSVAPTVIINGTAAYQATGFANLANDDLGTGTFGVTSVTLTHYGSGYTTEPTVTFDGSSLSQATATVQGLEVSAEAFVFGNQNVSIDYVSYDTTLSSAETYFFGKPTHIELTSDEYQSIVDGNINWTNKPTVSSQAFDYSNLGNAGIIVLNKAQTTLNNKFEGYYVGLADNNNFNPATDFNSVLSVDAVQSDTTSIKNYTTVPSTRLNFGLSATKTGDGSSISEVMEGFTQYDLGSNSFQDTLCLGLFKLRQSVFSKDTIALDYVLSESHTGSLDYHRQIGDKNGGPAQSFYLGKSAASSPNVSIIVNPNINNRNGNTWLDDEGIPSRKVRFLSNQLQTPFASQGNYDTNTSYVTRVGATSAYVTELARDYGYTDSLFPVGIYSDAVSSDKNIGALPQKLERVFELVDNSDVYPIDIALEAGLGTIYVNAIEQSKITDPLDSGLAGTYDDSIVLNALSAFYSTSFDGLNDDGLRLRGNYTSIANIFINVAEKQRKDFLVILDPLRNIFVQSDNSKILNYKKLYSPNAGIDPDPTAAGYVATNFSQHIYWPLRHQFGTINCSYATTYANWAQVLDPATNRQIWIPFSGIAGGLMANTDANFQPWYAPAGFTRGIVTGVNDLAVYPKQKQRDQLYKISMNPIAFFPNEGFVVFGQKTLLKKPSAFDRINVRRLFLNLEKATKNTAKFFVFEPNTLFTRTQVINVLSPIFENAKNTEGLYDYRIVCSELNNTPDVIDNNELKIDIYIQPVRTAEFILVNFYATRTGTNFDELIGA